MECSWILEGKKGKKTEKVLKKSHSLLYAGPTLLLFELYLLLLNDNLILIFYMHQWMISIHNYFFLKYFSYFLNVKTHVFFFQSLFGFKEEIDM